MKRQIRLALTSALVLTLSAGLGTSARAEANEIIGHALHTEIVAKIDGEPIASYNVAGRTAVMVQDLAWYGFYVYWNEEAAAVYVWPESLRPGGPLEEEPSFVPQPPQGPIGTPAYPIYASDIKVYVAGEEKPSFNIGGHVMVYLSDLTAYGDVTWNQKENIAALQVAQDPVELALDRVEAELKEDGLSYRFERYPGSRGTLAVYSQSGTPHGRACGMLYVDQSGQQTQIDELLPAYGFGAQYYLEPRDITFDETGTYLTFITPVKSETSGKVEDWGDTRCVFHTGARRMESMIPLGQSLVQWSAEVNSYGGQSVAAGQPLQVTVTREAGTYEAKVQSAQLPWQRMGVTVGSSAVTIVHESAGFGGEEEPYTQAFRALQGLDLPDISHEGFVQENTQEQRAQAAQYIRVTKNGQPVSGVAWWGRGNGHVDLNFTFDQSVSLAEGDILELWVGLLAEK